MMEETLTIKNVIKDELYIAYHKTFLADFSKSFEAHIVYQLTLQNTAPVRIYLTNHKSVMLIPPIDTIIKGTSNRQVINNIIQDIKCSINNKPIYPVYEHPNALLTVFIDYLAKNVEFIKNAIITIQGV